MLTETTGTSLIITIFFFNFEGEIRIHENEVKSLLMHEKAHLWFFEVLCAFVD